MSDIMIKPYELSIWEDELVEDFAPADPTNPEGEQTLISYYKENKIAIIASNNLKGPNAAYNIVFKKNKNSEKTLSFSLKSKYYDPVLEQELINPFCGFLINERKIKLKYNDEWYDFIIKECNENSEEYEWSYVAYDAFVLELSKNGYDVELKADLNNNQGTALDLALKTLQNTDWETINIDVAPPRIHEPIYEGEILQRFDTYNMDNNSEVEDGGEKGFAIGTKVFIFYSFIAGQNGKFLQFILQDQDGNYEIDENNNIIAINYRLNEDVAYDTTNRVIYFVSDPNKTAIISYERNTYDKYQAYKYVFKQLSTYDSVMERMIRQYKAKDNLIYGYTDSEYTTSDVVISYMTGGSEFNTYDDGNLQGWSRYNNNPECWPEVRLTTYPEIDIDEPLIPIENIKQLEGFLEVKFMQDSAEGNKSYLCNSGIDDHAYNIGSISQGEKYLLRFRGGKSGLKHGILTNLNGSEIKGVIAFYTKEYDEREKQYYNTIDLSNPIFEFNGEATLLNNFISGGYFDDKGQYIIDGVLQEPSTRYIYIANNEEYYWDVDEHAYKLYQNSNFLDYYYLTSTALQSISEETLSDITSHIGIFLYTTDTSPWYYLQDIQLTKYYEDEMGNPVTVGNIPKATIQETDYFYLAPAIGTDPATVKTYATLEALAEALNIDVKDIEPLYNGGAVQFIENQNKIFYVKQVNGLAVYEQFHVLGYSLEKVLSVDAAQSNCFNILQTIAETFECWIELSVQHQPNGELWHDVYGRPNKQVLLRNYIGKDNYSGFKYGVNLDSIERQVDSNEIVTKLIVTPAQNEYVDSGIVSIQNAESNVSGESYLFNFNYYLNQGLLGESEEDKERCKQDIIDFNGTVRKFNQELKEKQNLEVQLEAALTKLGSNRNIYSTLLDTAKENLNKALDQFEQITGYSYYEYQKKSEEEEESKLLEIDTITDIVADIYTCASVINNYSGLLANTEIEYNNVRKQLKGSETFTVTVSRRIDSNNAWHIYITVSDYVVPFEFTIGAQVFSTSLTVKDFDIITNDTLIENICYNSEEFKFVNADGVEVDEIVATENRVQTFRLLPLTSVNGLDDEINKIIEEKKEVIKGFYNKYSRFIQEGTWSSTDYISDEMYYLDALQISDISAYPQVTYNINVVAISGLSGYEGYEFDAGDKTFVEDTEFFGWHQENVGTAENPQYVKVPVREKVIVSEVEWHLDDPSANTITVQNYRTRFQDLFQRIQATVQTVQYNEATYAKTSSIIDNNGMLQENVLVDSLNLYSGRPRMLTSDGSILINGDQILIQNLTNSANVVKLSSEGISVTNNGGVSWTTTISGNGVSIENLFAGSIDTDKITIGGSDHPSFRWDSNGLSAFKKNEMKESLDDSVVANKTYYTYNTITEEYDRVIEPQLDESPKLLGWYELVEDGAGKYNFNQFVRLDRWGLYGIKNSEEFVAHSIDDVKNQAHFAVTWDGFFIKNTYEGGGRVQITSEDDFEVIDGSNVSRIKIGSLGFDEDDERIYGIRIKDADDNPVFWTENDGSIVVSGTINALGGNFSKKVTVGKNSNQIQNYIIIDGENSAIYDRNYERNNQLGWCVNKNGDAVFNNISARGAIKTAVFEYTELQAVGGIFLFRPSSVIKTAEVSGENIVVTVENGQSSLFYDNDWCKVSNYSSNNSDVVGGLTCVYPIQKEEESEDIVLIGAAELIQDYVIDSELELVGGALVSLGGYDTEEQTTVRNYGIGINSSDYNMDLPQRAISLFETDIDPSSSSIEYNYRGILGTLPPLSQGVDINIYRKMRNTQGIYTNNIYLGDEKQYLAFYTDENKRRLKIKANSIEFEDSTSPSGWSDITDIEGITLIITSNKYEFANNLDNATLTAHVYKNGEELQTYTEITELGYQINWYVNNSSTPIQSNSKTYNVNGADSISVIAKLEDKTNL